MIRKIETIVTGRTQYDGAGVKLVRILGNDTVRAFDPFLMLDAFDSNNKDDYVKGFPWHPHRGIETITYLIHGKIQHGDSIQNVGLIEDGGCQWMTAGSGIIHQEMPLESEQMLGIQLWLNLPRKDKMTLPVYRDIKKEMIPVVETEAAMVHIISGEYQGVLGAIQGDFVKTQLWDILLKPDSVLDIKVKENDTLFIYIVLGEGYFDVEEKDVLESKRAILFSTGDTFYAKTGKNPMRFIFCSAEPLKEPIVWGGPIVMNTKEELQTAFDEIADDTFIKHPRK